MKFNFVSTSSCYLPGVNILFPLFAAPDPATDPWHSLYQSYQHVDDLMLILNVDIISLSFSQACCCNYLKHILTIKDSSELLSDRVPLHRGFDNKIIQQIFLPFWYYFI